MKENRWDAYVFGDINIDLVIPNVDHFPLPGQEEIVDNMNTYIGGGAALFTLGLGKLGLHPVFQGIIGNDLYRKFILNELTSKNVDSSLIHISSKNGTGISISFTNEKERSFLTYRGTNNEIDLNLIEFDKVREAKHIHLTGYSGRQRHGQYLSLLKKVKRLKEITISFDVGWDVSGEWYEGIYELFPYIDVLFMNETEAIHYGRKDNARDAVADFSKYCSIAVAKLGGNGSIAFSKGEVYEKKPYKVKVIDTTGAGDSFNAGFIYGYLKGKNIEECLKYGNACGALSVTALGGNTAFPTEQELFEFIKQHEER